MPLWSGSAVSRREGEPFRHKGSSILYSVAAAILSLGDGKVCLKTNFQGNREIAHIWCMFHILRTFSPHFSRVFRPLLRILTAHFFEVIPFLGSLLSRFLCQCHQADRRCVWVGVAACLFRFLLRCSFFESRDAPWQPRIWPLHFAEEVVSKPTSGLWAGAFGAPVAATYTRKETNTKPWLCGGAPRHGLASLLPFEQKSSGPHILFGQQAIQEESRTHSETS